MENNKWVVESSHVDPSNIFVKVDDSDSYTAFWAVQTSSEDEAKGMVEEYIEELALGNSVIKRISQLGESRDTLGQDVRDRIDEKFSEFDSQPEGQMAAWITSNGGLW